MNGFHLKEYRLFVQINLLKVSKKHYNIIIQNFLPENVEDFWILNQLYVSNSDKIWYEACLALKGSRTFYKKKKHVKLVIILRTLFCNNSWLWLSFVIAAASPILDRHRRIILTTQARYIIIFLHSIIIVVFLKTCHKLSQHKSFLLIKIVLT